MSGSKPSEQVVLQRVRNRIIEYLEVASSFEEQRRYQEAVPHVSIPSEMINQYEDWAQDEIWLDTLGMPVFSKDEQTALKQFHKAWKDVAGNTPNPLPVLEETLNLLKWQELKAAARRTLSVFSVRGKLPEDEEVVSQ